MTTEQYIKKYILPNDTKENQILYYKGELEYDEEYIKEHKQYNTLTTKTQDNEQKLRPMENRSTAIQ